MRYRTLIDTDWHDGPDVLTVLAGELVEVIDTRAIPDEDGRRDIERGIRIYADQGRKFVAIQIRDWFALIEAKCLESANASAPGRSPQDKRRPLDVPGLRGRKSAPCATD